MKQYIVLVSMIALGIFIFNVIAGSGDGSIYESMCELWEKGAEIRTYTP